MGVTGVECQSVSLCLCCASCTPLHISLHPTHPPLPRHWQNSANALPLHGFVCGISSNTRSACYAKRPLYNKYHILMPQVLLVCFAGRICQPKACSVSSPPTGARVTFRCSPSCTNRVYQCRNLALCCWGPLVCGCPAREARARVRYPCSSRPLPRLAKFCQPLSGVRTPYHVMQHW